MASFQTEYEDTTNTIDNIVSTQLSSVLNWSNIPGSLTKVSSSAAGYAWGITSTAVYKCQLPCSGKWEVVTDTSLDNLSFLDVVTDNSNVYILGTTSSSTFLAISTANGQTPFTQIKIPFSATEIFSTHSFIWAQDSSYSKQRCPKPCTMSNWIANPENKIKITSSSDTSLYGIDSSGNAMKTDETLQSGWTPIAELAGTSIRDVIGDLDQTAIYGVDSKSSLLKIQNGSVIPQQTQGYAPMNLTIDPTNQQMWMTSTTPGQVGNIFSRLENPDYSTIMNTVTPLDKQRDELVSDLTKQYNTQTEVMTVNKQISDVVKFFKDMFKLDGHTAKKGIDQAGHLQEQIRETQQQLDYMSSSQSLMQSLILLLVAVSAVYMIGSVLGSMVHIVAIIVLIGGLFYISNFSSSN